MASASIFRNAAPSWPLDRLPALKIGGLTPLTSTDFPGGLAAVVFCQGCPWRCGYCHNPHLIPPHTETALAWEDVLAFLHRRRGLLDAVVFSGGEPTLQREELVSAIGAVRELGFKVGLHTAGAYPAHLGELLPQLDWVGMDIKSVFDGYDCVTGVPGSGDKARESARLLLDSGVAHEFRTTVHPLCHNRDSLLQVAAELRQMGAKHYVLQEFRPHGCSDTLMAAMSSRALLDDGLCERLNAQFEHFAVRLG